MPSSQPPTTPIQPVLPAIVLPTSCAILHLYLLDVTYCFLLGSSTAPTSRYALHSGELHTSLDTLISALRDRDRTFSRDPTIPRQPPQLTSQLASSSHGNPRGSRVSNSSHSHRAIGYTTNSTSMSPTQNTAAVANNHSRRSHRGSSRDKG